HAMLSSLFDAEGCHLDEDGEIRRQLCAWATFAVQHPELLSEERIQEGLARLGDSSLISEHYYTAAFAVYAEALVDHFAAEWPAANDGLGERAPADFPDARERQLAVYYPSLARYPALCRDPSWEPSMRSFLAAHYDSWNRVYAATYSGAD